MKMFSSRKQGTETYDQSKRLINRKIQFTEKIDKPKIVIHRNHRNNQFFYLMIFGNHSVWH